MLTPVSSNYLVTDGPAARAPARAPARPLIHFRITALRQRRPREVARVREGRRRRDR